ncbi:MAG: hypothetical protein KAH38_03755 [Candidatus Hydrogenedentes bacterium]|nr:hypothetical protein [Candidatus Hydrogenedentota bacterium]
MKTISSILLTLGSIVLLAANTASAAGHTAKHYQQNYFVIGFWGDPPVDNLVQSRYTDVVAAHFNVVMGGVGADAPSKARIQRDACEKYHLKVLFPTYGLPIDQLCDCDTTYGFLVRDHPSLQDFESVRAKADEFRKERPTKLPFVNLFPSTASNDETGAENYNAYLKQFIAAVQPEVLCFDHYPFFAPETDGREGFCSNLDVIRSHALEQAIPFWCFIKAMPFGSDATPTEAQIRWQVYAALTYGVKGILYSSYFDPSPINGFRGTSIIDPSGKPTERYEQVTCINAELQQLGPVLLKAVSTGVWHSASDKETADEMPVTFSASTQDADFLVGSFRLKKGDTAIMIMNYKDRGSVISTSVSFAGNPKKVLEISKETGKSVPVSGQGKEYELEFAPGEGRLFLLDN